MTKCNCSSHDNHDRLVAAGGLCAPIDVRYTMDLPDPEPVTDKKTLDEIRKTLLPEAENPLLGIVGSGGTYGYRITGVGPISLVINDERHSSSLVPADTPEAVTKLVGRVQLQAGDEIRIAGTYTDVHFQPEPA